MIELFSHFARPLGSRPLLLFALLLLWGVFFGFGLVMFIAKTDGLVLFELPPQHTAIFVGALVVLAPVILLLRVMRLETILSKNLGTNDDQLLKSAGIQVILAELRRPPAFISSVKFIIHLAPVPVVALTGALMIGTVLLKVCYETLSGAIDNSVQDFIFANIPWAIAVFLLSCLIYADIHIIETLNKHLKRVSKISPAQSKQHQKSFSAGLTAMELHCFQEKYVQKKRNKEIAATLNLSESTIKTHVNNINKKWDAYASTNGISLHLKDIMHRVDA